MPGRLPSAASTQPGGVGTLMPSPLSSHTSSNGNRWSVRSNQPAALNAAVALAWLIEASPNEHMTTASGSATTDRSRPSGARSIANARPTPRGRCDPTVEVVGTMRSAAFPNTLCRPPAIGSSVDATSPRITSRKGSVFWTWAALAQ
jgi:hypothetical protein